MQKTVCTNCSTTSLLDYLCFTTLPSTVYTAASTYATNIWHLYTDCHIYIDCLIYSECQIYTDYYLFADCYIDILIQIQGEVKKKRPHLSFVDFSISFESPYKGRIFFFTPPQCLLNILALKILRNYD